MKYILSALVTIFMVTFAHGADLKTPFKAPIPPVAADLYTGFYIGGALGYGWDRGNLGATFPGGPADFGDLSNAPQGFLGGGYLGVGTRFQQTCVFEVLGLDCYAGIEGAGYIGNLSGTAANPGFLVNESGTVSTTNDRWLARAAARLGLIYQNVMFFGSAGWGWGGTTLNVTSGANGANLGSSSMTENGFSWSLGVEFPWFFGPQWKARVEYVQWDFGTNVNDLLTTPVVSVTQKNHIDAVLAGLNFRF